MKVEYEFPVMSWDRLSRRNVLKASVLALSLTSAGCIGGSSSESTQSSPEVSHAESTSSGHGHDQAAATGTDQTAADSHGTKSADHDGTGTSSGDSHGSHQNSSSGGHHDGKSSLGSPVQHAEVALLTKDGGYHFEPHVVHVKAGGTVTWTLESGSHSATAYSKANGKPHRIPEGAGTFDSGVLSNQGAMFEHTFKTEGVYDYFCTPHESLGMIGTVVVGNPEPSRESHPGLQPPQDSLPTKARHKIQSLNERVTSAFDS